MPALVEARASRSMPCKAGITEQRAAQIPPTALMRSLTAFGALLKSVSIRPG
jgi:hypothetical protein